MNICHIAGAADVACIKARPYAEFIAATNLLDALSDAARRHANRPAISFIESADIGAAPRVWSHAQFTGEVRRAANLFRHLAGASEPRIAMLLPALPQAHFTLWGGEAAGMVRPINYLLNTEHIAELIVASAANILVVLGPNPKLDIWSRVAGLRQACPGLKHVLAVGGADGALDFDSLLNTMPGDSFQPGVRCQPTPMRKPPTGSFLVGQD